MLRSAKAIRKNLLVAALSLALVSGAVVPMSVDTASAASSPAVPATKANGVVKEVPISSVSFPQSITLKAGESKTLNISVSPSNTTYLTNISWGYQTNGYFNVKTNGCGTYWSQPSSETITGLKSGKGYLNNTVKVFDSTGKFIKTYKFSTTVNVSGTATKPTQPTTKPTQPTTKPTQPTTKPTQRTVALSSISLSKTSVTLTPGAASSLRVDYNPSNTTVLRTVTWSSSNTSVARVSNGYVTAVNPGTATITASCNGKKATCKVTVKSTEKYWNVSEAYKLLNNFRTTKSNQWYWKSDNRTKQKVTGLKALKADPALEAVAKLRAKEQWIMCYERGQRTHTRPNGKAWSTAYPKNLTTKAENLAWGHDSCKAVIGAEGWAETYKPYQDQGHRRHMLSKSVTKVGIACYEKDGLTCWAMCLGK